MLELAVAARHAMDKLAERGLTTAQTEALELCGALGVSAMSVYAATGGRIDRRGRFNAGLRAGMRRAASFAEPGLELLSTYWARRTELFIARFERSGRMTGAVRAHRADATALPFPDATFDAIVCDPPYFDNIQYADEAEPYRRWLQLATRLSVHQILDGPPRGQEIVLHREDDTERERERYETLLRRSLEEAGRVLRDGRCLSLLYPARDPAQLDAFLRLVQPRGFELVEAVRVATESRPALKGESQPASYVLLLRKAHAVTAVPLATADAGRVLELADRGKSTLYAAIVDILVSEWEEEDLADRLSGFVGSREHKIAELVAGSSDPGELLAELGARALRRHADGLEIPKDERPSDAFGLANEILKSIGFTVPEPPAFTFTMQLEIVDRVRAELPLAADLEVLRGRFLTGAHALELAIRYGTVAWLQLLSPQGWLQLLEDLFRSVRDEKPFRGSDAFSFGDWVAVFGAVPNLEDQAPVHLRPRLANLRRALTKRKARQGLDRHVGTRNRIEHNKEGFLEQPFTTVRAQTQEGLNEGARALLTLINERALPQVLQPLEESRDRWNRVLLRAINEKGIRVEMYIEQHLDLTQPCLWFPGGANPREVAPLLVPLQMIEAVTGQRR
jgi:SAM-dependent methyltransferase